MLYKNKKLKYLGFSTLILLSVFYLLSIAPSLQAAEEPTANCGTKEECEKKAKVYENIIKLKDKQITTVTQQLQVIDQEQVKTKTDIEKNHAELLTLSEQIASLENSIREKEVSLKYQKVVLANLMRSYYENYQQGILDLVVMDKNMADIFQPLDYSQQTSLKVKDILSEIKNARDELEKNRQELADKKDESEKIKESLEDKNLNLQYTENKKNALLGQTQTEKEKYKELLASIDDEIYNLESGLTVDYSKIPAAKGGYFDYPVSSIRITQKYGMTSYAKAGAYGGKPHNGVDFGISSGSNIFAVKSGTVARTGNNGKYAYGKWVAIDHGDGLLTLYGHLSSQSVFKGAKVQTGDIIGKSGNTGYSTGPHLHFSVFTSKSFGLVESKYVDGLMIPIGASINPIKYLD